MALPSSGTISLGDLQGEFGGTNPVYMSEYYRGGGLVPNITANNAIPLSGVIKLSDFYNSTVVSVNLLEVITTSTSSPPSYSFAYIQNESTSTQNLTFTWQYVSQAGDLPATISYDGTARSAGYTTPAITEAFGYGTKFPESTFAISGGNATTITFKFTLTNASVDNVPSSPDNATTVTYQHNY